MRARIESLRSTIGAWRYDVVIRNGTVVDGSGFGSYRADVGVVGGRIACVGRIRERGTEEIDAEGHVVTPGFIDGHTHMDAQVFWDPLGAQLVLARRHHGGDGQLRVHPRARCTTTPRALVVRNLERAEDIDPAALAAGIEWSWETFPEYLDAVDRAAQGHQLRRQHRPLGAAHLGDGGARVRATRPTDDDLARMAAAAARTRCGPAPSASRRRAASTTRPPTTARSRRGWRRGTRCARSSA